MSDWIRTNLGELFSFEGNKVYERTPLGPRVFHECKTAGGKPDTLNEHHKQEIWSKYKRFLDSRYGRAASNPYDMNEKWFNDIKQRKATRTAPANDGSGDTGVFLTDTGERVD